MNDRFKFRVWDKKEKRFLDHPQINPLFGCVCGYENSTYPLRIEQCTGLKDKNGKLIFEGDIVKIGNGSVNGEVIESDLVVEWICKNGRYNLPTWTSDVPDWSHYVEIIGNIHKQPEQKE